MNTDQKLFRPVALLAFATGFLLLIPLVAMKFTNEVNWTLFDFTFAGSLLFGTGLAYLLVTRIFAQNVSANGIYRIAVGFALFTGLLLVWVNLAVGIVGSENNPANLMYFGVIPTGIIGGLIVRFSPKGMFWTMCLMALLQGIISAIIIILELYKSPPGSIIEIIGVNGVFISLFVIAGLLFRYAGEENIVWDVV